VANLAQPAVKTPEPIASSTIVYSLKETEDVEAELKTGSVEIRILNTQRVDPV
jgi:hypothetical protein